MFHAAANTELVQSEVFLQYHTDLASRPRLPAVEFFKICETLYPGVAIEHRPGPSPSQPLYVVTGMARRQVRSRGGMPAPVVPLTPTPTLVATPTPVPAPTPVTAPVTVKTEVTVEVKQEKPVMRAEKEVQFEVTYDALHAFCAWLIDVSADAESGPVTCAVHEPRQAVVRRQPS